MQKIKLFFDSPKVKNVLIIIIIILVGVSSFSLGRLSKTGKIAPGIDIEYPKDQNASAIRALEDLNSTKTDNYSNAAIGNYVASKRGKKYYPIGCSAGKSLKEENRIYFTTSKAAEAAGYELSGSCD